MRVRFLDPNEVERFRQAINSDPEFSLAAQFMTKDALLGVGDSQCIVRVRDGVVTEIKLDPTFMDPWNFSIKAPAEFWQKFLQPMPPPFYNGLFAGMLRGTLKMEGDLEAAFAHFWAMTRMLDVMRQLQNE
jgi:hypothetical protein